MSSGQWEDPNCHPPCSDSWCIQLNTFSVTWASWRATGAGTALAQWLSHFTVALPAGDPRPLVAVILVDAWLWFAFARVGRAMGDNAMVQHRHRVAAS